MLDMRIRRECRLSRYCHTASGAQPQSGCRTFEQHLAPETHEPRRPAAGFAAYPAGLLDQTLVLDETPIGTFVELEGPGSAIDQAARALGFSPRDYVLKNYLVLYVDDCKRRNLQPSNMLFP